MPRFRRRLPATGDALGLAFRLLTGVAVSLLELPDQAILAARDLVQVVVG
jgi:hypothetical protein